MNKAFRDKLPFNIDLLFLSNDLLKMIGEVKSKDIFEQNSTVFKSDGLFSEEIFGLVGSDARSKNFNKYGYINLHLKILHPKIYKILITLKTLYKDIIEGKKYAIFDEDLKDFVVSDISNGKTGYSFFMKHFDKIEPAKNNSTRRTEYINFIKKYDSKKIFTDNFLVLPAGLRDYTVTESGKVLEDEINNIYRKILSVASTCSKFNNDDLKFNESLIDKFYLRLQKVIVELYEYIEGKEGILNNKEGFITGKWLKPSILYGTRNVLSPMPEKVLDFGSEEAFPFNHTAVGLYQYLKGILPLAIYSVRNKFLNNIFDIETNSTYLINAKTLKKEIVKLSEKTRSKWITDDGLEKIINKLKQAINLKSFITIDGHYLYLIYEKDDEIIILDDIEDLPEGMDDKYVRPMKYSEFFYLSVYDTVDRVRVEATRFPVDGYGSTYPSKVYLKTTLNNKVVKVRDLINGKELKLYEYPDDESGYYTGSAIDFTHLNTTNADYDGFSK